MSFSHDLGIVMKRLRIYILMAVGALGSIGLVGAILEPNQILIGICLGDAFFDWRPVRYWRDVLTQDGQAGNVTAETISAFGHKSSSLPVLTAIAKDADRNARWPAVFLLGRIGRIHTHETLPALRLALTDDDVEVRLQATIALGNMSGNAMSASSELASLMKDPEPQVQFMAEMALWHVNRKLAIKEGGWQPFDSPKWGFKASFPTLPLEEKKAALFEPEKLTIQAISANHGVSMCVVAITDYPEELFKGTDEERLDAGRDLMLFGLGGKLLDEKTIECGSIKGREILCEATVERNGVVNSYVSKNRVFWIERRLYHVQAMYSENLSIVPAMDYFLDSFEFLIASQKKR